MSRHIFIYMPLDYVGVVGVYALQVAAREEKQGGPCGAAGQQMGQCRMSM